MLKKAHRKWNELSDDQRLRKDDPKKKTKDVHRMEDQYPDDGLVLSVYSRDLNRNVKPSNWKANAWNSDFAWFRRSEARKLLPERLEQGQEHRVPKKIVHRLARFHLIDNVRGQTRPYPSEAVRKARLTSRVLDTDGSRVTIRFTGTTKTRLTGTWSVCGFDDRNQPKERERGYHANLRGKAVYNRTSEAFETFELLAAGRRWGGTQYNGRCKDLEPAPMGVYFTFAENTSEQKVAPAFFWKYQW